MEQSNTFMKTGAGKPNLALSSFPNEGIVKFETKDQAKQFLNSFNRYDENLEVLEIVS